jgi:tRNA (cytidine/uridine-2'-O-)-methyltransferase
MNLVCFEPEIPQNVGTLIRTTACFGAHLHLIAPLGFVLTDKHLRRAHMDYKHMAHTCIHDSWSAFQRFLHTRDNVRLIGITPDASLDYTKATYTPHDFLLVGSESTGLGQDQKNTCNFTVRIPMAPEARSLNIAIAASMVMGEFLRQNCLFP